MSLKLSSALARIPRPQLPERFKGTIVERWVNYWKGLGRDYKGEKCMKIAKKKYFDF
jgi:hypothetical protein